MFYFKTKVAMPFSGYSNRIADVSVKSHKVCYKYFKSLFILLSHQTVISSSNTRSINKTGRNAYRSFFAAFADSKPIDIPLSRTFF